MYIGIDIGGTNIKAVAVARDGAELARVILPTDDGAEPGYKTAVPRIITELENDYGTAKGIGISSPGLAARDGRTIIWMMGRMAGVMGFDWTSHLKRPAQVYVLNDAHAALLGEVWLGAAAGKSNVVLLTLGTGVGGAIMCDGRLLKGHLGRAGHLGHLSLNPAGTLDIINTPGSLEDAMGDCTIQRRSDGKYQSTRDLVAAIATNPHAAQVWQNSIRALAAAITSIANAVDPEIIVLGGGMMAAGDALLGTLQKDLDRFEWRPTGEKIGIVRAAMGDFAGAFGAAYNAIHEGKI